MPVCKNSMLARLGVQRQPPRPLQVLQSIGRVGEKACHRCLEGLGFVGRYRVGTMREDLQMGSGDPVGDNSGLGGGADPVVGQRLSES